MTSAKRSCSFRQVVKASRPKDKASNHREQPMDCHYCNSNIHHLVTHFTKAQGLAPMSHGQADVWTAQKAHTIFSYIIFCFATLREASILKPFKSANLNNLRIWSHGAGGHGYCMLRHGAWRTAPISSAASVAVRSTSTSRQRSPSDRRSLFKRQVEGGQGPQEIWTDIAHGCQWNCFTDIFARIFVKHPILASPCFHFALFSKPKGYNALHPCTFLSRTLRNGNLLGSPSIF